MEILSLSDRLREVKPGGLVLDIGCGTGLQARELASTGRRVIAVDLDFDAVATGRELSETHASRMQRTPAEHPSFVAARAEALPFRPGIFDVVVCIDLMHWPADAEVFKTIWRQAWGVLAPGGILLLRVLLLDFISDATPLRNGRHRLRSGAEWYLPSERLVKEMLATTGAEAEIVREGGEGSAWIRSRKIR